ncbi:lytic transglycosylase domain-containing protein [Trichlorobacter lovleyi]|uniref:lytic transglycosylase domain-containing protein n=1 Tax=Trichlorobacter lovleyi TaxID=313985 RepID=UPI00223EC78B|nr:lytic transglycosylase domain-containing protein [Trichlorobacter lovleyi]
MIRRVLSITVALAASVFLLTGFCFQEAGERYGIPPEVLMSISKQESGMRADLPPSWNKDGSYDVGVMRINSNWYHWSPEVRSLWPHLEDPCTNVMVGAWLLARCIHDYGYNWKGIGCYNSRTPSKNEKYARSVARQLLSMRGGSNVP